MDIHWRDTGKRLIKLITGTLIVLMLLGCKTHKKVSENIVSESVETSERVEILTKENPYKIVMTETVVFDTIGNIVPLELSIIKNDVIGKVTLSNNELIYTLESKDTILVSKDVKEIKTTDKNTDTITIVEKKKNFFESIKSYFDKIHWTIVFLVVIIITYKIVR